MKRIVSIDIVRGIVMMLMAIDHVRVYAARSYCGSVLRLPLHF